ncbi:TPA: hypothetical protein ACM4HC_004984, partial [Escherichia coli]
KNTKRQENTRPNQKNASESFSGVCITIHESDARSVSTVQKRERVKTANFLIQKTPHGTRNFFVSRETLAGFGVQPRIRRPEEAQLRAFLLQFLRKEVTRQADVNRLQPLINELEKLPRPPAKPQNH